MAKTNNLKDFLVDLYEGIASKKPNASRNPQDFRSEIESISSGRATIKSSGGTNVEKNTYIEKLYINNSLSIEELYAFCDSLDFDDLMYVIFINTDKTKALQIVDLRNYDGNDYGVIIAYSVQGDQPQVELIFSNSPVCELFTGIAFADGWYNTSKDFCIEVNAKSYEEDIIEETGFQINPNDTSQLVSTTPFTNETIELSGEYDGAPISITENTTVDMKTLINEKKIPLSIEVNAGGFYEVYNGAFEGNAEIVAASNVEGNTLYVEGTIESRTLTLNNGSVENNTLII